MSADPDAITNIFFSECKFTLAIFLLYLFLYKWKISYVSHISERGGNNPVTIITVISQ